MMSGRQEDYFPPCSEFECGHNFQGTCSFLNDTGGTPKEVCSWFIYESDNKCDECYFSVEREGKTLRFCKLKGKAIPPKPDACSHWRAK